MKKYMFMSLFALAVSSSFVSCRETKDVVDETEEAVEEGVDEVDENLGDDN